MLHPRQFAEQELAAAMLAVSGYDLGQQQMLQSVSVPYSQVLTAESEESDNEEIRYE
jgi:hypothetical protein